jgi:hypothetical protein
MSRNTENWILTVGYLLIAIVSLVVMWALMWGVGILIRPMTDWLSQKWWFWLWTLALPYMFIKHQLKLRAQKKGEILPPIGSGGGSGSEHDSPRKRLGTVRYSSRH